MSQKSHSDKKNFLHETEFWFDISILIILWISTFYIPRDLEIFKGASLHDLTKIVALISSLEVLGFFSYHFLGKRAGVLIQGFLGGFVSSTMTYLKLTQNPPSKDSRATICALLLATVSMLLECIFIILTINGYSSELTLPIVVQLVGLLVAIWIIKPSLRSDSEITAPFITIEEPIIWKKVLYFTLFIVSLIYAMRFISNTISLPYIWTSFLVSLFEAHGTLAAAMTEYQGPFFINEAKKVIVVVLIGNVISKTFFLFRSVDKSIRLPTLSALIGSLLLALITFFI